ncbi:MAG: acyl-CoA dehydrogenase family protein [Caulobacteraceae bacterium]
MDFSFNDEQRMLRDSLSAYLTDAYSFDHYKAAIHSEIGWRPEVWRALAQDLGILGAALPEALGGLGGGPVDNLVVMEELGRALVVEPYLETVVIGAGLLKRIDSHAARDAVARIIAGDMITALAWSEPTSRNVPADISTAAVRDGEGWRLDGRKAVVIAAPFATHLIVTARSSGGQRDEGGVSLFLVEADAPGVTRRDYATVDGRRASEIALDGVKLGADALLGEAGAGLPLLELVLDEARAALCAEALGVMSELQRQTLDYAKQRKQFGHVLGDFQVLQHRMVDMFMSVEQSVSMTYMATLKLDQADGARAKAVSAAKAYIGKACKFVGQNAVQIHGGIALTEELPLSHYFKRATMIESQLGSVDYHLGRYQRS